MSAKDMLTRSRDVVVCSFLPDGPESHLEGGEDDTELDKERMRLVFVFAQQQRNENTC